MSRITQDEFDAAADKLLKEANYDIEKVLTNHVSVRLGKPRANGNDTTFLQSWKERRIAEGVQYLHAAPDEFIRSLAELFEGVDRVARGLLGKYYAEVDRRSAQDSQRWNEQNQLVSDMNKNLKADIDKMRQDNERLATEMSDLKSALNEKEIELDKTNARLKDAQDLLQLLARQTRRAKAAGKEPGDLLNSGHDGELNSPVPRKRRVRPRRDQTSGPGN